MKSKALCVLIWCLLELVEVVPACTCIEVEVKGNHKKAFEKWLKGFKGAIFTGEVSKIEEIKIPVSDDPSDRRHYLQRSVTFTIENQWKGAQSSEAVVETGTGASDCGYPFQLGKKYYLVADLIDGKLITSTCSGTEELEQASKKIDELNKWGRKRGKVRFRSPKFE